MNRLYPIPKSLRNRFTAGLLLGLYVLGVGFAAVRPLPTLVRQTAADVESACCCRSGCSADCSCCVARGCAGTTTSEETAYESAPCGPGAVPALAASLAWHEPPAPESLSVPASGLFRPGPPPARPMDPVLALPDPVPILFS